MIDNRRPRGRWQLLPATLLLVVALLPTAGSQGAGPAISASTSAAPVSPSRSALAVEERPAQPDTDPSPDSAGTAGLDQLLALPGPVPAKGRGKFTYAPGTGSVLGTAGPIKQFWVAVERDIGEDAAEFAEYVEYTLSDPLSWVGGGQIRLRRVSGPGRVRADFTVFLASRESAAKMCGRSGTDIRTDGVPYTSCRTPGKVIINLDRWRLSAPTYLDAGIPLAVYRQYVINHEVGHELGHAHQDCPKRGGPAPVMVQQTLTLRGCVPYAWPRIGGRWLAGPPTRH